MRRTLAHVLPVGLALFAATTVGPASAATPASGVAVSVFADSLPHHGSGGPIGLAFDAAGGVYVADLQDVYRFGPAGGSADSGSLLADSHIDGRYTGLAFAPDGRLYAGEMTGGDGSGAVVELDPATGATIRTVAADVPCPTGLAVDPVSRDLFVSEIYCGKLIARIHDPESTGPAVSTYAAGRKFDGLTFAGDGTLWAAHAADADGNTIARIAGTASADPGRITEVAAVPLADGIALSASGSVGGRPNFLVVNRNDGTVTRLELDQPDHPASALMTGGSRGDLTGVGNDGCLYATQTSSVLRLTNADGTCTTSPTPPAAGGGQGLGGLTPSGPISGSSGPARTVACTGVRTVHLYLPRRGKGLTSARIYRGNKLLKRISGRSLRRQVVLRRLPRTALKLTIKVRKSSGRTAVSHRTLRRDPRCR